MKKRDLYYDRIPTKLLREDVSHLRNILGNVIKEQEGIKFFNLVEKVRKLSKANKINLKNRNSFNKLIKTVKNTNPKDTFNKALAVLRKTYKKSDPQFSRELTFENFSKEFAELDGSINGAANEIAAKVGMTIRALQTMGKLGFAAPTSIADLGQYMATTKFQGRGLFNGLFEALGSLFKTQDKAAMEVLGVVSNSIHSFQGLSLIHI